MKMEREANSVITDIQQLTPAWFDTVLARSGALHSGGVQAVEVNASDSNHGQMVKIWLGYKPGSTGPLPAALLLKIYRDPRAFFGPSEVHYYARDYVGVRDVPIPTCYDAQYSEEFRTYHLLVDDLSATHQPSWEHPQTLAFGCAVAEALAALHAPYWGEARLRAAGYTMPGQAEIDRYFNHIRPGLEPMLEASRPEIDPAWETAIRDIFEHHPEALLARTQDPQSFTLVHGDANLGNILSPREGPGKTYLIDRQPFDWSLVIWLGVSDLAYFLGLWWQTEPRRQWELPILRHYHTCLEQHGITDYSWDRLLRDYQLTLIQGLYIAAEWCVLESERVSMKWVWFRHLQRSMAAFFDHQNANLWTR